MKNKKIALQIAALCTIVLSFIACDKDFATLESDILNSDNATTFLIKDSTSPIISYTKALEPVQTKNLGLNTLGIYDDAYGRTTSSFVTQVTASSYDPSFGEGVSIDSVVLKLPYFSTVTDVNDDGDITYEIDSVFGREKIKLRLFESNYFIRDFDPSGEFDDTQDYYSNRSASETETISNSSLESEELMFITGPQTSYKNNNEGDNIIEVSEQGFVLEELDDEGVQQISSRESPGIRIKLDTTYWRNKIIDKEGDNVLSSQNTFSDYFRGLYFKAEPVSDKGSFLILNTGSTVSSITIYYTSLTASTTDDADATEQNTFVLTFGPNTINFMDNDFTSPINTGDPNLGDSRLYLKGGAGSLARIKLFNGDDINDGDDNTFDDWKSFFVETDEDGNFVRSKRLINEANLVFYVDQDAVQTSSTSQDSEPNRIYVYDVDNKTPLFDYFADITNSSLPSFSKYNHLGPLQRVGDEPDGNGIKYKLKITEHINDLILRDSTNVELGLAVSLNVNIEESFSQKKVLNSDGSELTTPLSSILTPRGTILFGSNIPDDDVNADKKVYLEIYYTEPNN